MKITMQTDPTSRALLGLLKKFPQVMADGLNRTGDDCNAALRVAIAQEFTIRDKNMPRYVAPMRLAPENRAKPESLVVTLETDGKGRILAPFESGIPKVAKSGLQPVAVPTDEIRYNKTDIIPRTMYPQNLGLTPKKSPTGTHYYALGRNSIKNKLTPFKTTVTGKTQIKGKRHTFVLDPSLNNVSSKAWGVYERLGPGKHDIHMIWSYRNSVKRPAILRFVNTIMATAQARLPLNIGGVFAGMIRRSGPR